MISYKASKELKDGNNKKKLILEDKGFRGKKPK